MRDELFGKPFEETVDDDEIKVERIRADLNNSNALS